MSSMTKQERRRVTDNYWIYQRVFMLIAALMGVMSLLAVMTVFTTGVGQRALVTLSGITIAAILGALICRRLRHRVEERWFHSMYRIEEYYFIDDKGARSNGLVAPDRIVVVLGSGTVLRIPYTDEWEDEISDAYRHDQPFMPD